MHAENLSASHLEFALVDVCSPCAQQQHGVWVPVVVIVPVRVVAPEVVERFFTPKIFNGSIALPPEKASARSLLLPSSVPPKVKVVPVKVALAPRVTLLL